jgi:threonine/homoserine efflux transporter RhtA
VKRSPVSGPAVLADLTPHLLLAGFRLALLLPVIPFSLEMYALRRMTTSAFGTLMCLEVDALFRSAEGGLAFWDSAGLGCQ